MCKLRGTTTNVIDSITNQVLIGGINILLFILYTRTVIGKSLSTRSPPGGGPVSSDRWRPSVKRCSNSHSYTLLIIGYYTVCMLYKIYIINLSKIYESQEYYRHIGIFQ